MFIGFTMLLVGIILMSVVFMQIYDRIEIIKLVCLSVASYFSMIVVISTFYFLFNSFNTRYMLMTIIMFEFTLILLILFKKRKIDFTNIYLDKNIFVPILIVALVLPLTYSKFEFFGMGQDEGVYQTKAIDLMYGKVDMQQDFEEYHTLNASTKEIYKEIVRLNLIGFDNYDYGKPNLEKENEISDVSGIYHGIPNFPALLALWAEFFGMENMQGIQTLFYVLSIFLVYFICNSIGLSKKSQVVGCFLFAISPITIWVSKSALTEMFLAVIVCSYILFLVEKQKNLRWISSLFIVTFAFFHVSIYTMMPLFIITYFILYFYDKDEQYLYAIFISLIGYYIGFEVTSNLVPTYIFNNYRSLYEMTRNIITEDNLRLVIVSIVLTISLLLLFINSNNKKDVILDKVCNWKKTPNYSVLIIRAMIVFSVIFVIFYAIKAEYIGYTKFLTLAAYTYLTGFIILPTIYFLVFFKTKELLKDRSSVIIIILFIYVVVIYSCILRQEIPYYYYYARYLVPFIPIITILAAILFDKYKNSTIVVMLLFITAVYIPFNKVLATEKDDSRLEWSVLEDVAKLIDSDDIVVMDEELMSRFYLPLRAMTGAKIYPTKCYSDKNPNIIKSEETEIYYLSNFIYLGDDEPYDIVYRNTNTISEDKNRYEANKIPLALSFEIDEEEIVLHKYQKVKKVYDFSNGDFQYNGFGRVTGDTPWSRTETTRIQCILERKKYIMDIKLGNMLPLQELNKEFLSVDIYINGQYFEEIKIDKTNNGQNITVLVDEQYLNDGENIIEFRNELWSPSDYGSQDSRKLGISLKGLEFKEIKPVLTYDFGESDSEFTFEGFSGNEGSFRWTDSNPAEINVILDKEKSYEVSVYMSTALPSGVFADNNYGYATVNGSDVKKELIFEVNEDYEGLGILKFKIDADELTGEVTNTVEIHTDLWSPADFGSIDERRLGIPIDKIVFTALEKIN